MAIQRYSRKELIEDWSNVSGFRVKDLQQALTSLEVVIRKAILSGKEVSINDIGRFSFKRVKARKGFPNGAYNVATGEWNDRPPMPAHYIPAFKFSKKLRDEVRSITAEE